MLLYNGEADSLLKYDRCKLSFDRHLQGVNVTVMTDTNLGHSISMREWSSVSAWLSSQVGLVK